MIQPRYLIFTLKIINNIMEQYLLPKARCVRTGQTVKDQDLTGHRFTNNQRTQAQERADQLAKTMSDRTREDWTGFVVSYSPSVSRY